MFIIFLIGLILFFWGNIIFEGGRSEVLGMLMFLVGYIVVIICLMIKLIDWMF